MRRYVDEPHFVSIHIWIETIENAKDKFRKIADVLTKEKRLTGKQFEELMEADG